MKLYDIAFVCRSKNAGPFQLTVDLMFSDRADYDKVLRSPAFTPEKIALLYRTDAEKVMIKPFERILTIKVVIPRLHGSGSPDDTDVYGSQQHFPLGNLEI
ncbi:MAG: DUF4387 domain-containing protein [Lentisphaeria bacterium]|nr:DUF4387 domain-containing protein [Lentisphaeria bacterium]